MGRPVRRPRGAARRGGGPAAARLAADDALAGELPLAVLARRLPLAVLRPLAGGLVVRRARREGDVELERLAVADDGELRLGARGPLAHERGERLRPAARGAAHGGPRAGPRATRAGASMPPTGR